MAFQKKITTIKNRILDCFGLEYPNFKFLFLLNLLSKDWSEIIGHPLCDFTKPGYINIKNKNKILYVYCKHNGMIQTLGFESEKILNMINDRQYGYIFDEIKFVPYSNNYRKKT